MSLVTKEEIKAEVMEIVQELRIIRKRLISLLDLIPNNRKKTDLRTIIQYIDWSIEGLEERF